MGQEANAARKERASRCIQHADQGSMRGIDRELAGKCACAGAPMISSAVVRAVVCWRGGEAILTSRQPAQTIFISQGAFRTVFFYSVAAGSPSKLFSRPQVTPILTNMYIIAPPLQPSLARNDPRGGARNYVERNNKDPRDEKMTSPDVAI